MPACSVLPPSPSVPLDSARHVLCEHRKLSSALLWIKMECMFLDVFTFTLVCVCVYTYTSMCMCTSVKVREERAGVLFFYHMVSGD